MKHEGRYWLNDELPETGVLTARAAYGNELGHPRKGSFLKFGIAE